MRAGQATGHPAIARHPTNLGSSLIGKRCRHLERGAEGLLTKLIDFALLREEIDARLERGSADPRPEMVRREGLGSEARQAQRAPQGQGRGRAQARSHSASHVDRRDRVQLVEEGDCCLSK